MSDHEHAENKNQGKTDDLIRERVRVEVETLKDENLN